MKPKCLTADIINSLPDNIIDTILCLVPIKDAVRTSILSKNWRYNWNKIPKLVFKEKDMFDASTVKDHNKEDEDDKNAEIIELHFEDINGKCKICNVVHQVLIMHDGVISEFTLSMKSPHDKCYDEIDKIITYLSRKNTVKKFTLEMEFDIRGTTDSWYKLPLSVFALHQLTDLYLENCHLNLLSTVNGFACLTSLCLNNVVFSTEMVIHLLSKCPLLKSFSLGMVNCIEIDSFNLAFMCELFGCLPAIAHLDIYNLSYWLHKSKFALPELPTPMVHLKSAHLPASCFIGENGMSFAVNFIRNSPNLEILKLHEVIGKYKNEKSERDYLMLTENSDIRLERLKELEFKVRQWMPELKFVKLILAKSPMLKKVKITFHQRYYKDNVLRVLKAFSETPHASQMIELVDEVVSVDD
ncbi:F-box/FBD/LRR-repeat protein At1g13570-like [Rutidosis leptorrhynchoides]|uniref:F-box/FBD/LRR-repeat protein At1g13570-like n=1 Tax=Rutidosis leptorrhynchoides TaxID=125765 RepID=UPI003A9A1499